MAKADAIALNNFCVGGMKNEGSPAKEEEMMLDGVLKMACIADRKDSIDVISPPCASTPLTVPRFFFLSSLP